MLDFVADLILMGIADIIFYFVPATEKTKEKMRLYGALGLLVLLALALLAVIYVL